MAWKFIPPKFSAQVKLAGTLTRLNDYLEDETARLTDEWATDVQKMAKALAPVRSGHLKQSIKKVRLGKMKYTVRVGAKYGVYVEYGTRYMHAQPFMTPAAREATRQFRTEFRTMIRRYAARNPKLRAGL